MGFLRVGFLGLAFLGGGLLSDRMLRGGGLWLIFQFGFFFWIGLAA